MYTLTQLFLETQEAFEFLRFAWTVFPAPVKLMTCLAFGGVMLILFLMMFRR